MITAYLIDVVLLLLAAVILVPIFQILRLGAVPGFLIAGIIVGPSGLGVINNTQEIGALAEIGVVLLLFVIGIELKPSRLWRMRRLVFGLGTLQVLITGVLFGLAGHYIFSIPIGVAILIGFALSLSSTAFVLQILSEQKLLISGYGRTSIAVLLLQDLAVVPLLALVPLLASPELGVGKDIGLALLESLLILSLVVVISRYLIKPLLHLIAVSGNSEVFTALAVLIVLGTALVTEHAGLSMAMGAFLAGLLISESSYRHQIIAEIQPFRGLFLGLFFMSMGMSLNLNLLLDSPLLPLAATALLMGLKVVLLFPIALLFKLDKKKSLAVSLLLAQSGEFALIIFSLAYQSELLTEAFFQQLLLVVLLSMMATPAFAQVAQRLIRSEDCQKPESDKEELPHEAPIVLAGFGRVGHRIGEILTSANKQFVALDSNPAVVKNEHAKGYPVFFGDVRHPGILKSAGADNARTIIVTLNDPSVTEEVVSTLRNKYPDKLIYARGHSLNACQRLSQLGASDVVSENVEASLELARMAITNSGMDEATTENILSDFRKVYHQHIHGETDSYQKNNDENTH